MKKPASLAEAAAIAQFKLAIISPVLHELYPDSSRTAYYERITEKPFTLPDGSTVRYSPNTISSWVSKHQRGGIDTTPFDRYRASCAPAHAQGHRIRTLTDHRGTAPDPGPVGAVAPAPCLVHIRKNARE